MGSATESTRCFTSLLSITRAYELVPLIACAAASTVTVSAIAVLVFATSDHTCCWSFSAIALPRTFGAAIGAGAGTGPPAIAPTPNRSLLPTQRPALRRRHQDR